MQMVKRHRGLLSALGLVPNFDRQQQRAKVGAIDPRFAALQRQRIDAAMARNPAGAGPRNNFQRGGGGNEPGMLLVNISAAGVLTTASASPTTTVITPGYLLDLIVPDTNSQSFTVSDIKVNRTSIFDGSGGAIPASAWAPNANRYQLDLGYVPPSAPVQMIITNPTGGTLSFAAYFPLRPA